MVGRRLGHYRILAKIGAGGMGQVYRARDEQLDREVAIKVLPEHRFGDPAARARLLREARTASKLNHPHICTVHEVGEAEGQAYIVMEYVEGRPLSEWIARRSVTVEQALRYAVQIADGLAHAHERGVVHRDLKCANVVITSEERVKVLDFGLAKRLSGTDLTEATTHSQASLSEAGAVVGTLPYMAPEQLRGEPADAASDIWALGVMLYEMIVGARPFQGQTGFELSSAILNRPPPPLPAKVPVELRAVIERCLAKERARRYQRGSEARAVLEAVQSGAAAPWAAWRYRLARRPFVAVSTTLLILTTVVLGLNVGELRDRLAQGLGLTGPPRIESLAVLPLQNLSGDPGQDYFADGMTEALITELSKMGALKVISRASAMRYKDSDKPVPQIARELRVDALIDGSVQREGDQVRITVQLVDGPTDRHLWAHDYQRELRSILVLQGEVARAIAKQVKVQLTPLEQARLAAARPVNPEAYEAYLKGRSHWYGLTPRDFDAAMTYFQLALEKDPEYALAYAGIGATWVGLAHFGFVPAREGFPKAKAAALKAIELDDTIAEAHATLANVRHLYEWDWQAAETDFQRAMALKPHCAEWYIMYWNPVFEPKRSEERLAELRRCLEADPLNPWFEAAIGIHLSFSRRYDEAIVQGLKALKTQPGFVLAYSVLMGAYYGKRMHQKSLEAEKKYFEFIGDTQVAEALARGQARAGYFGAMHLAAETLVARSERAFVQPTLIASFYARAGEKDLALSWYEKAYQERDSQLAYLGVTWDADPLRSDPRFQALLGGMNLPQ
jgi:serine/threonine-protein kinase